MTFIIYDNIIIIVLSICELTECVTRIAKNKQNHVQMHSLRDEANQKLQSPYNSSYESKKYPHMGFCFLYL